MRKGPYAQSPFSTCDKRDALTLTTHLEKPKDTMKSEALVNPISS